MDRVPPVRMKSNNMHTDTQLDTLPLSLSLWHSLFPALSGGLLEPLLKSKPFRRNLWPPVLILGALCSDCDCDSCPVESQELRDLSGDMRKCQNLIFPPPNFLFQTFPGTALKNALLKKCRHLILLSLPKPITTEF